ncbi:MAG: radical SAM protein, partial [Lachnospiraceae bacterium]|nr:radical SAM protein [Lachnospiraceae bacterium]
MKVFFLSLGCDKNLCDSEHMLKYLLSDGFVFTDVEEEADVAVINSCSFIGDAKKESIDETFRIAALKREGNLKALIVTGCLPERYKDSFMDELPEVDACLGINDWDRISEVVKDALQGKRTGCFSDSERLPVSKGRVVTGGGYSSYLKIAEGCDKRCTYCAIPFIRGAYRSVPMEELVKEASELALSGVRELNLVAQETTRYGIDLYGKKMLPELIAELSGIDGIHWIRVLYCYPEEITDDLVAVLKTNSKVVPY